MVTNLAEVLFAKAEERRAVEFRVATDVVIGMRMERLAILVLPHFFGVIFRFDVDRPRTPIVLFAPNVVTPLYLEDLFTGWGEVIGESPAPRAGADDDHVVMGHAGALILDSGRDNADTRRSVLGCPDHAKGFTASGRWPPITPTARERGRSRRSRRCTAGCEGGGAWRREPVAPRNGA